VVAVAGCSGSDGKNGAAGANGANGVDGTNGTNGTNGVAGKLALKIDGVVTTTTNGVATSTLTFTISPAAVVCPGGTCNDTLSILGQKTFYATEYNATNGFDTSKDFSFGGIHFKGITADGNGAQYTATATASPTKFVFAVESSASAFVYGYVATTAVVPAPSTGHYYLPGSVASAAKVYGTVAYTSTANVSGCEGCHGAPYSKHGYRQAKVAGLNDFVSCKACHTDQRAGSDADWYVIADDPAAWAAALAADAAAGNSNATNALRAKYPYTANIMNDTHNSHAFEFAYPQSMSNCVTCHAGKLDLVLTDANFTLKTCKSCHPVTGVAGIEAGRAPALKTIVPATGTAHTADLYTYTGACNTCHSASGGAPTLATIHSGYNKKIYDAAGAKYSAAITTTIGAASFDSSTNVLTIPFSVAGAAADAIVKPTVVISLYGYDTKDFVLSGHSSQPDGTSNLEYTEGAMQRNNPTLSSNSSRLVVAPTMTAGNTSWTATADLSLWASMLGNGTVKRLEIAVLPALGTVQNMIPDDAPLLADKVTVNPNYNPFIAMAGATQTFDLVAKANVAPAKSYGKGIVSAGKCNACHDALGTTFHGPNYGSAGVVACRLCHTVASGGSHLEMQSRSIDSYVHAIHSMQAFDIDKVDFANSVAAFRYDEHKDANYPNFAGPLNCESCHAAGTYDVPDQARSLPGLLSASKATLMGWDRNIGAVPAEITGPGARACGSCHRAQLINEDNATMLASLFAHTNMYSSNVSNTALFADTAAYVESLIGGPAFAGTVPAGAQVEQCAICHPTSGTDHQALFNTWKNGL
jgi:hypothetical protein